MRMEKTKWIAILMCFFLFINSNLLPLISAQDTRGLISEKGFTKGVSYKPVVPLKKAIFVNFDEQGILDDYAYLAAIPATVFTDGSRLFSNPLLFYQDTYPVHNDTERSLNARQGIDYFMEDWMAYSNGQLDKLTLINVPKSTVNDSWKAKNYTTITSDNPYDLANQLALVEWSYSDTAIVATIQDHYETPQNVTEGTVSGRVPPSTVGHQQLRVQEPVIGTGGTYQYFYINDTQYKYIGAQLTWPNHVDYDLQLYDTQMGMLDNGMNGYPEEAVIGLVESVGSYIHDYGKWGVSVTAVPVKSADPTTDDGTQGGLLMTALKNLVKSIRNEGTVDVSSYPGTMVTLPQAPFGCRDVDLSLSRSNPATHLGFTLLDPTGTEICSSLSKEEISSGQVESKGGEASMHVDRLGECKTGENYSVCVFSLDDLSQPVDFTLGYRWHQNFSKIEAECFASAANGAVLASTLNAPLLYVSPSELASSTKDTLYKLGVKNIYLVNIGSHLSKDSKAELSNIATVTEYSEPGEMYTAINEKTGNTKMTVFTTIDSWSYWYVGKAGSGEDIKPVGEYPQALFVGPAAYLAAHHGSPVAIVDLHPQLSQATVYPTDFWVKHAKDRAKVEPTTGSMLMSGREVYSFLKEYGLGNLEPGKAVNQIQETLITVADQFDIGAPWDRMLTGAALNGRFWGSPVDTAYAISRNVFYPALIFINPAMQGQTTLINGSSSQSKLIGGRLRNPVGSTLAITKPSKEEPFTYPILETYNTYEYRFNEKASKYWDFQYTTADGIIPYVTPSPDPIDDGATDKAGAYYPDLSETEVIPFYATKAGYDNVFSTNFSASVEDLNRGVILWVECCHGWYGGGGDLMMWDPNNPYVKEGNPWRAYEPIFLYPGNIREFFREIIYGINSMNGENSSSIISKGLIKFHLLPTIGSTANPDVAVANPQKMLVNKVAQTIGMPFDFWGARGVVKIKDRFRHPLQALKKGLELVNIYQGDGKVTLSGRSGCFVMIDKLGIDFDNALNNLHSCGLNTISCMPAYTYLHLTWMRHGMSYEIIDPWTTTDWGGVWNQMLIKLFAEGYTVGQAYERGMRACGPEPIVGQWWWDKWENVEMFGDPSLRVYVPGTDYSNANHWNQTETMPLTYDAEASINGHMPFGVTGYPNEKTSATSWSQYLWVIGALLVVAVVVVLVVVLSQRKKERR